MSQLPPDDRTSGRDLEALLRATLAQEADRIMPTDRIPDIRSATAATPARHGLPAWFLPVAASLLVAVLGLGTWLTLRPGPDGRVLQPAGPTAVSAPDTPSVGSAPSLSMTASTTIAARPERLPVYYIGSGTPANPWLLHRDFLPGQFAGDGSPAAKVAAAVTIAVSGRDSQGQALPAYPGYQRAFADDSSATASVTATEIRVTLSAAGRPGLTGEQQRIGVQQVVWTATAAAGANVPVRIEVAGGGPIFADRPAGVYQRPTEKWRDLAPLWILDPLRTTSVTASKPVSASGEACTFEAAVQWELLRGDGVVKSGHTTASVACPDRGTWRIELGRLTEGDYVLRVFESSPKDGSVWAEDRMPFHVGP